MNKENTKSDTRSRTSGQVKPGYKKTSIGIIPEDWDLKSVSELVKNKIISKPLDGNHGNIHPKSEDYVLEGIPFILANNLFNSKLDLINCKFIAKEKADKLQKGFSTEGDILLSHKGSVGNVVKVPKLDTPYIMLTPQVTYYRVLDFGKLSPDYLLNFFRSSNFQNRLKVLASGGTRAYIGITEQRELPVIFPPLAEQKSIADCLSTWDAGIEKLTQLINAKEQHKKGLMQQLLTGTLRLRSASGEKFDGEWKEVKIKDISKKKSSSLQANSLEGESGIYPVYGATGFLTNVDFYEEEEPYIGIVKDGSGVGNMYFLQGKSSVLGTLDKILPKNSNLYFLYGILKNLNFEKYRVGGAIPHIYYKDYSNENVLVPPLKEQTAIAELLQTADKEIELLEQKLAAFQQQKKGLMQVLLTGEKRLMSS